jgi:hypothetical protein
MGRTATLACRPFRLAGGKLLNGDVNLGGRRCFVFPSLEGLGRLLHRDGRRIVRGAVAVRRGLFTVEAPQLNSHVLVDRAGMRFLLRNA